MTYTHTDRIAAFVTRKGLASLAPIIIPITIFAQARHTQCFEHSPSSLSVCLIWISESAYMDAISLRLQHGQPPHNNLLVLSVADVHIKALLYSKSNEHIGSEIRPRVLISAEGRWRIVLDQS